MIKKKRKDKIIKKIKSDLLKKKKRYNYKVNKISDVIRLYYVMGYRNFFSKNFFFRRFYIHHKDIYAYEKKKKKSFILKLFFFKFLRYIMKRGKLGFVKKYVNDIFFKIKYFRYNPFLILIHALYNSLLFFEYKKYSNKVKGRGIKRMKKKDVKFFYKPIVINRKRQIFIGFKVIKKFSFLNTGVFYKKLINAALNTGDIINYVKDLNKVILHKYYLLKKEVKSNFVYFRKYYWRYVNIMVLHKKFVNDWV